MAIASSRGRHFCTLLLPAVILGGCSSLSEHANEYFATPTSVNVNVPAVPSEKILRTGHRTIYEGHQWQKAQVRMPHATATFYRLANRIYTLERVKVAINGTVSYTRFLVSVPHSYAALFAQRPHTSQGANDAAPPYPVPIYLRGLPAPIVKRVLPGEVALQTSELQFTMLRGGNVGVFGDRDEPSLLFLYAEHCDPCDEDLQAIAHQADAMRRAGISIYMVVPSSVSVASAEKALRRFGVSSDITTIRDRYGALFAYLRTNTMPRNYIFSHEGTVAVARMGSFPDGELQRALSRAGVNLGSSIKE